MQRITKPAHAQANGSTADAAQRSDKLYATALTTLNQLRHDTSSTGAAQDIERSVHASREAAPALVFHALSKLSSDTEATAALYALRTVSRDLSEVVALALTKRDSTEVLKAAYFELASAYPLSSRERLADGATSNKALEIRLQCMSALCEIFPNFATRLGASLSREPGSPDADVAKVLKNIDPQHLKPDPIYDSARAAIVLRRATLVSQALAAQTVNELRGALSNLCREEPVLGCGIGLIATTEMHTSPALRVTVVNHLAMAGFDALASALR